MSRVFVDTSAVIALLVATDEFHQAAKSAFAGLSAREAPLLTTSYVLVETYALLDRRLGIDAVRRYREHLRPDGSELSHRTISKTCWRPGNQSRIARSTAPPSKQKGVRQRKEVKSLS